jgi:hypothetical protein
MTFSMAQVVAFISFVALVAPAVYWMGRLSAQISLQSSRLDKVDERFERLENLLRDELRQTRVEIKEAIEFWRNEQKGD